MRKRFWLIIGFMGGLAIATALLVFVWLPSRQSVTVSPVTEEKVPLQKGELEAIAGYKKAPVPEILAQNAPVAQWTFPAFKEPEFKPFFEEEATILDKLFLEKFASLSSPPSFGVGLPLISNLPLKEVDKLREIFRQVVPPKITLTDEQWFSVVNPKPVLDALPVIEDAMKATGFIASSEELKFNSEEDINVFFNKVIEWASEKEMITETGVADAKNGLDVVIPNLQEQEKKIYEARAAAFLLFQYFYQTIDFALKEKNISQAEAESLKSEVDSRYSQEKALYDSFVGDVRAFLFQSLYNAIDSALNNKIIDAQKAESLKQEVNRAFPLEKSLYDSSNKNKGAGISLFQIFKRLFVQLENHFIKLVYAETGGGTGESGTGLDVTQPYLGLDFSKPYLGLDFSQPFLGLSSGGGGSESGGGLDISEPYLGLDLSEPFGGLDFSQPFLGLFGGGGGGGGMGGMGGMGGGGGGFGGDCYREGGGFGGGGGGYNTFAICCNCGLDEEYNYVSDCDNSVCEIDLGCKNLMCTSGPMIWDQASFTCGCG